MVDKYPLSFRSSRVTYYGPQPCENCGVSIVKMAQTFGGNAFTTPSGPIYPNSEWHVHICNPADVLRGAANAARCQVLGLNPQATAIRTSHGWVIACYGQILSACNTYCDTPDGAWLSALESHQKNRIPWRLPMDGSITVVEGDTAHTLGSAPPAQRRGVRTVL